MSTPDPIIDCGNFTIVRLVAGAMDNNVYVLTCASSQEVLVVDAAAEPERILATTRPNKIRKVLTTHSHRDHWEHGLAAVVAASGATSYAGRLDASAISVHTDVLLDHGDTVTFGAVTGDVIGLSGHTPGSVCLVLTADDGIHHIFSGDSLFPGGVGKTTTPDDFRSLIDGVTMRIFDVYDDSTVVHPGHGLPTTLGSERGALPHWRERGW